MNCPSCGAPIRLAGDQDCLTCDYCKSIYYPEANAEGVRILGAAGDGEKCPVCDIPLVLALLARQRIRYCSHCYGMLIPMGQFMVLIDQLRISHYSGVAPHNADARELDRRINCPQCHHPMDTHYYGGPGNIVIDDCSPCELNWLDHGELMRIVQSPDRAYADPTGFGPPDFGR